jgi:hypothetical protein
MKTQKNLIKSNAKTLICSQQKDATKFLKKVVKIDTELLINIHSVSKSGMSRKMSLYVIAGVDCWKTKNGKDYKSKRKDLIKLNWYLKQAGLESLDERGQIKVGGCGMDMAFALTYNLKCALYGYEKGVANQQFRVI